MESAASECAVVEPTGRGLSDEGRCCSARLEDLAPMIHCERAFAFLRGISQFFGRTPAGPSMGLSGPALLLGTDMALHGDLATRWVAGTAPLMRASTTMVLATGMWAPKASAGGAPHATSWLKGRPTTRFAAGAQVPPDAARPCKSPWALGPAGEPSEAAVAAGWVRGERLVPPPCAARFGRSRAGSASLAPRNEVDADHRRRSGQEG